MGFKLQIVFMVITLEFDLFNKTDLKHLTIVGNEKILFFKLFHFNLNASAKRLLLLLLWLCWNSTNLTARAPVDHLA